MAGNDDTGTDPYGAGAVERVEPGPESVATAAAGPVGTSHHVLTVDDIF
jgi:hypothetical protein